MTLREYISFWRETYDRHQSRPTTYAAHNYVFKNHILPGLGDTQLSELTSERVGEFLEERKRFGNHRRSGFGLGEETMRHIHRLLQQCLDQAMRDGLISDNPARAFHYSKPKKVNADVLTASVRGSGDMDFDNVNVNSIEAYITGSGGISLVGKTGKATYMVVGSGDIDAAKMKCGAEPDITVTGSGSVSYQTADGKIKSK